MDRIGPFPFVRLDQPPQRVSAQWEIFARAGIDGNALYNTGTRGEPFSVVSEAVALNFLIGSTYLLDYKTLELAGPVPIWFGALVPQQLYKVLKVEWDGPGPKAVPRVHLANDTTWYTCLVYARWHLLPLDPLVQRP